MRKMLLIFILIVLFFSLIRGQTRRIVLMEEATNASCAPCASNNPKLQAFFSTHFGGVISVRYHAWWPGSDPMYSLNTIDNTARIQYYGITGVPNYLMDGTNYGVPGDPLAMVGQMWQDLVNPSPVKILVEANIDADSVRTAVSLIGLQSVTQTNLHLRTAIIERMIVYAYPPGSNGEKVFPDVMRKLLPDANGISIASINPGDTLTYQLNFAVDPAWNWQDLAVVSWLQSDATKEVIQSNINLPTYIIETSDPTADLLDFNQTYSKNFWIYNDNTDSLHLRIIAQEEYVPAQWSYSMMYNSQPYDSFDVEIAPGDSIWFQLQFQTGSNADQIKIGIFAKNLNDPYRYGFTQNYFGIIPEGNVLFVDDDGGDPYETNYYAAFDSAGVDYTSISEADLMALASQISTSQFQAIFWNVSWGFPAFSPADITFLQNYLDNGGNLYLAGQDIGWDIFDPSGSSNFPAAQDFYHNYLDAQYVNDNAGAYQMQGVPGDPITDGIAFNIIFPYTPYPEWIDTNTGSSIPILQYIGGTKYGALRYDSGTYKTVYLGVDLEQMSDTHARNLIVKRTLAWFGIITDIEPEPEPVVYQFNLEPNYPNPFNPSTTIRFSLPQNEKVVLSIYDLLGKKVVDLVNGNMTAGWHTVEWNGKNQAGNLVASGVYIYRLQTGNATLQKKMLLVR